MDLWHVFLLAYVLYAQIQTAVLKGRTRQLERTMLVMANELSRQSRHTHTDRPA